ncbi:MAG: RsmB/NOP family class I SAM-dependent RNA methyltransferase, partial [Desulfobaccales bacterium]
HCGPELTAARLTANNRIPPLTVRVNTLKTDPAALRERLATEGVTARAGRFSPAALILETWEAPPTSLASYQEGLWLFQDEAAQLVSYLLPIRPGARLAEIGAGRGGKTTQVAEAMADTGLLAAVDSHRGRLHELQINVRRAGVRMVLPIRADAAAALPLKAASLDAAVLDVPCSALGILRRHPEIKTRLRETDLDTFPPRQRGMLEETARALKPGGHLLYITCTTEPEENETQIEAFLSRHPDFHLATDPGRLPAPARDLVQPPGWFRTSSADHDLDALFAAVLAKS